MWGTTGDCGELWGTVGDCRELQGTTGDCGGLQGTAGDNRGLRGTTDSGIVYGGINSDVNRMESTRKALELYSLELRSSSVI